MIPDWKSTGWAESRAFILRAIWGMKPLTVKKNANLISRLDGVPKEKRTARFVCAIAAALPDGNSLVTRGTIEGYIGWEECGSNGFGYDPIFYLYENDKSTAELSAEEKNAISHRGKALRQMKKMLEEQK